MNYSNLKVNLVGVLSSIVLLGSDLFAQPANGTVSWAQHAAVPMSTTSMVIMMLLFLIIGIWMLSKMQKNTQNLLVIALFMATMVFSYKAVAIGSASITTSTGTIDPIYDGQPLQNDYSQAIQITSMTSNHEACSINPNPAAGICKVGTILQNGESCTFQLVCDDE
jgi:glucose-6-phosphate-specific signal transduction histidine kinase